MKSDNAGMIKASLIFIIFICLYNIFSIFIEYYMGTFGVMIMFLIFSFLLGTIAFSIIKIYVHKQHKYFIYILAAIISIALYSTQAFRSIGLKLDFSINRNKRLEVVEMLQNRTIEYGSGDEYVQLPSRYSYLSRKNGQIMVYEEEDSLKTCFYASGGLYKKQDIVVYISNDDSLAFRDFGEEIENIRKLDEHWYSGQIAN